MKKFLPLLFAAFIFSCGDPGPSPESLAIEKATLQCWNKNWVQRDGYDISKGITLLDDYLFSKGLLGKRTVEDYKKFFSDTAVIYIPDSVKGSDEMNIALNSDFAGTPDVNGMVTCWEQNWFNKMKTLDTADVLYNTGKLVQTLSRSGDVDFNMVSETFFKGLTEADLARPLVKDIAYFIFWKTRGKKTHIRFVHPEVVA